MFAFDLKDEMKHQDLLLRHFFSGFRSVLKIIIGDK